MNRLLCDYWTHFRTCPTATPGEDSPHLHLSISVRIIPSTVECMIHQIIVHDADNLIPKLQ